MKSMTCRSLRNKKKIVLVARLVWNEGKWTLEDLFLWENNQFNSNSKSTSSHHVVIDYFPITSCFHVFYSCFWEVGKTRETRQNPHRNVENLPQTTNYLKWTLINSQIIRYSTLYFYRYLIYLCTNDRMKITEI